MLYIGALTIRIRFGGILYYSYNTEPPKILLMIYILHYLKDSELCELWYIPHYGSCRICIINRSIGNCVRPL